MEKYGETSNRGGHPVKDEWAYWKRNPGVPAVFVVATLLLLCVVLFLPSCATREKSVVREMTPDELQEMEDAYLIRHSPIFSPIWTP